MEARTAAWVGAVVGLALGAGVGAALGLRWGHSAPDPAADTASAAADPGQPEPDANRVLELEAEAVWWREAYEALARSLEQPGPTAPGGGEAGAPDAATAVVPFVDPASAAAGFDATALLERGYTEAEIQRLRERFEAFELEMLYLGDRARREGWRQRPLFQREAQRLRTALRDELGDRDFDAALYASGRNNRVVVAGVLADSAAARAGLRAGDELISYDGRRIFEAQAVVRATAEGKAGGTTELRVRRDDEELRFLLPRGPIGIRLQPARRPPEGFL